ncbi:MAG: hypothetical protein ACRD3W_25175, partial [Terriglobales bacterium]
PKPFRPDPSIEAIAADEPVAQSGFPPLPDRLDLPVSLSWGAGGAGGGGGYGGMGGGGMGMGGGMAGGGASAMSAGGPTGVHEHYVHYDAGAFIPPQAHGGGGGGGGMQQQQQRSPGYYKCQTPEQFSSNAGGPAQGPVAGQAAMNGIRALGKEPKLDAKADSVGSPDAPTPVVVNQATTQDLSLPEDEFQFKRPPKQNSLGRNFSRMGNQMTNRAFQMPKQMMSRMSSMHF